MDSDTQDTYLPAPPEEPLPSDCCGTGCVPCVFDIYEEDFKRWKKECQTLLNKDTPGAQTEGPRQDSVLSPSEFRTFRLEDIKLITRNSYVYRFNVPARRSLGLKVGQHVILRGKSDGGSTVTRQYTPVSSLNSAGFFEVLIKIYKDGKMSSYVKTWKVGDMIEWRGPFGQFTYTPNKFHQVCMLAAGTGIAPMVQVLQEILDNDKDDTMVQLLYTCHTYNDIHMKDVLDARTDHWNFNVLYAISREDLSDKAYVRYGDHVHYGRINQELMSTELPPPGPGIQVLICGTKSFDKDMIKYLRALGFTDSMYFKF